MNVLQTRQLFNAKAKGKIFNLFQANRISDDDSDEDEVESDNSWSEEDC